jgi:hypothetical protein
MTGTRFIRAVLVTDGRSPRLPAVFAALGALERKPDALHVVIVADADLPDIPAALGAKVLRSAAPTYSRAVDILLAEHPARVHDGVVEDELLWLLHDDTAPAPSTLARLDAVARKRPRAGVIGASHVRWDDASRLVNVGTTVPRWGGKRIGLAAEDDVDQGQHSTRDDVLAVSLAAALVSRMLWESLGGIDDTYEGFGGSVDFCRRAWVSGHDVVIVPGAKVRHSQESLYARRVGIGTQRATHAARRAGEWTHAFMWVPWWFIPLLALAMPINALSRAVMRVMQNHPSLVVAELRAPWIVLGRAGHMARSRSHISAIATRRGIERRLLAGPRQVWRHIRERELGGRELARMERIPTDVVRGELAVRKARNRIWFAATAVVGLAASLALSVRWLVDVAGGAMITGVGVGATDTSAADLWSRGWSGWSEAGLGLPALDGALATMLTPLAVVGGDLRVGFALALSLAPALATVGAWTAAGAATRAPLVRATVAIAYGLWPLFLASVADARLGPVIAHVALPWVAWGLAFATGWRKGEILGDGSEYPRLRRPSASAGLLAAVALAVATVAAPVLLLPALAALVILGARAGTQRWRVWTIGLLPLVIGLPGLVAAVRHVGIAVSILVREPGPSAPFGPLSPIGLITGSDGAWRFPQALQEATAVTYVPGALAVVAALCALAFAWRSWAVVASMGVAGAGMVAAAVSQSSVAVWPDLAGNPGLVGWPGAGSSLAAVGLLAAAAIAYGRIPIERSGVKKVGAGLARVAAIAAVVVFAGSTVALAWPTAVRGVGASASPAVLPLAVPLEQTGADRARAIVLSTGEGGAINYAVLASDGSEYVSGRAFADDRREPLARPAGAVVGVEVLADTVARLAAGGVSDTSALAAWGIGIVVAAPGEDRIKASLDSNTDVALVGGSERGTTYRIDRPLSDVPVSRAWIETTDGISVVPSTYAGGRLELAAGVGGLLVIAVPQDSAWSAHLNGEALYETADPYGRQAFALPSGGGTLEYAYRDGSHRVWWWAAAAATAWALLGAIPLGSRGLTEPES